MSTLGRGSAEAIKVAWRRLQDDQDLRAVRELPGFDMYQALMRAQFEQTADEPASSAAATRKTQDSPSKG